MTTVVGVDGASGGWVLVTLHDGAFSAADFHWTFAECLAAHTDAEVFGVDIPIGLPSEGTRLADLEARGLLGRRAATIFLTPPRPTLDAPTYEAASAICRELSGRGLSRQAYGLFQKIREVDAVSDTRVHEVHPEVSFARLAGAPLLARKHRWEGAIQRRALLAAAGIVLPDDLGRAGTMAGVDDVLDAAVAAWSAARIAAGTALALPVAPGPAGAPGSTIWS